MQAKHGLFPVDSGQAHLAAYRALVLKAEGLTAVEAARQIKDDYPEVRDECERFIASRATFGVCEASVPVVQRRVTDGL